MFDATSLLFGRVPWDAVSLDGDQKTVAIAETAKTPKRDPSQDWLLAPTFGKLFHYFHTNCVTLSRYG